MAQKASNMAISKYVLPYLICILSLVSFGVSDTPANCSYDEIEGTWHLAVGLGGNDRRLDCTKFG